MNPTVARPNRSRFSDSIVEGYWRNDMKPNLPVAVEQAAPWLGQEKFLRCLAVVEALGKPRLEVLISKGTSYCRICDCANGHQEFYDPLPDETHGRRWLEGLRHYIEIHNVDPSAEFKDYVSRKVSASSE